MEARAALRDYRSPIIDSLRWNAFEPRAGDVVIATPQKGGTTWTQAIVANLLFPEGLTQQMSSISFWWDARVVPLDKVVEGATAQTHKRFIKTHLPADGLPLYPEVRYLVVGRDGRDLGMSLWNHYAGFSDEALASMRERALNEPHDAVTIPKAPDDINAFWHDWVTRGAFDWQHDGWPFWSDLHIMQSWWELRHEPNVQLLHYGDMLADVEGAIELIADFIEVPVSADRRREIAEAVSFESMKRDGETYVPFGGNPWADGARTFFNQGTNGRWLERITPENLAAYDRAADRALTPACRAWVEQGAAALD